MKLKSKHVAEVASPSPRIFARQRLLLLLLVTISAASLLPAYRSSLYDLGYRAKWFAELGSSQQIEVYLIVTLIAVVILYGEGILGLWLAQRAGLNPMPLLDSQLTWRDLSSAIYDGLCSGVLCFGISLVVFICYYLFGLTTPVHTNAAIASQRSHSIRALIQLSGGRSVGVLILAAPIREEIEFRLFIVSLLVWALGRLRKTQGAPRHLLWLVISISGIAFGLLHVVEGEGFVWWCPIYVQVFVDARTYIGGLLAWLYWNRGIETAIIAYMVLNGMV